MEREFGEKSFRPAPFEFATIFTEKYNPEYQNLFARKLPGQILLATYYTPMTVREIAIELGVASVYLEDEIALLEKYNLMMALPKGKYLSNLVIFTDGFTNEFHRMAERFATSVLAEIVSGMREKLKQIREVNAVCKNLSNDRLLWGLLWPVMRQGSEKMAKSYPQYQTKHEIYNGATGTNYGTESDNIEGDFSCNAFAGHVGIDENYFASAADFGILPEKNRYFGDLDREIFRTKIYKTISGEMEPEFIILTEEEERTISEILTEEITLMAKLYDKLFFTACQLMHVHAPKNVENQIDRIVFQTLFFRTVGLIGGCAVKCEALTLPDFDGPAAVYVRKIAK